MKKIRSPLAALGLGLALAGCGVHFPDSTQIEDLRVLEIRTEPPEIALFDQDAPPVDSLAQLLTLRPQLTPVKVTALVVHPDLNATFYYEWFRCAPGLKRVPCPTPPERVPFQVVSTSSITTIPLISALAGELAMTSTSGGSNPLSLFTDDPRDLLNGLYAYINLRAGVRTASIPVDTLALEATKRVVIFDKQIVRASIAEARRRGTMVSAQLTALGLPSLCTNVTDEQLGQIFDFLRQRTPNRAPTYHQLRYARAPKKVDDDADVLAPGEVLMLRSGEQVELRGYEKPGDLEAYQAIDANCQLVSLHETLAWSWFATPGSISRHTTIQGVREVDEAQHTTTYTAPYLSGSRPMRARIWSVLRDGRGGSDLRVIDLEIRP